MNARGLSGSDADGAVAGRGTQVERPLQDVIVVALAGDDTLAQVDAALDELEALVDTAGGRVIARLTQPRRTPDPATYLGSGKVEELRALVGTLAPDLVVVDGDLSPSQQRNLEKALGTGVVDRTAVILDIFAQHAQSREGKVQVELAQLSYRLPRLRGRGIDLSQQGAGIGTRGPGETKLEVDRRRIATRISRLRRDLTDLERTRAVKRKAREASGVARIALVGYTNAGKSSLLNALTGAEAYVADQLFATLDPTVRRLDAEKGRPPYLFSDTVGFVRLLPHELVEAFRSTLEEAVRADALVHVVDAASPDAEAQIAAVRAVLREIGAGELPEVVALNKCDIADPAVVRLLARAHGGVAVSARTGEGLDELLARVAKVIEAAPLVLHIPYSEAATLARLHNAGAVVEEAHEEGGTRVVARVPAPLRRAVAPFIA